MYLNSDLTSLVGVRISNIFGYVIAPILILLCVPRVSIFLPRTFLHKWGSAHVLLIPEFCPGGQRQRLTLNKSTLLV